MGYRFLDDYDPQKEQKKRQQNGALSAPRSGNSTNPFSITTKKTVTTATTPRTTTGTALGGSAATPVPLPAVQVPKLTKTTPVQTTKKTTQPLKMPEIKAFGASMPTARKQKTEQRPDSVRTTKGTALGGSAVTPVQLPKLTAAQTADRDKVNVGKLAWDTLKKGGNEFAKIGGSTFAMLEDLAYAPFELIAGKKVGELSNNGFFNRWNDSITKEGQELDAQAAENIAKGGKAAEKVYEYGSATVAAIPQAIAAIVTAGGSEAASMAALTEQAAANMSPSMANTVSRTITSMLKDKNYWTAFAQVVGPGYEQAREDGATIDRAALYAVGNGLINAAVEAGGGIQKLPSELQMGKKAWKSWVNTMLDEGKEEAVQGVIERAMQNMTYGKNNPLFSVSDENAILNPITALNEFAGGAVVGGVLGGGQMAISHAADRLQMPTLTTYEQRAAEYRGEKPQNVRDPRIGRLEISSEKYNPEGTDISTIYGNRYRQQVKEDAIRRLGIADGKPAYLVASNITKNGREYYVDVTKASLNKMLYTREHEMLPLERILLVDNLEKAIDNSYWAESNGDRKSRPQIDGFDTLRTSFYVDGIPYYADIKVKVVTQGRGSNPQNVAYFLEPEEITSIKRMDTSSPTGGRHAPNIVFRDDVSISDLSVPQGGTGVNTQGMQNGGEYADNKLRMPQLTTYEQRMAEEQKQQAAREDAEAISRATAMMDRDFAEAAERANEQRTQQEAQGKEMPEALKKLGVAPFGSETDYADIGNLAGEIHGNMSARRKMQEQISKIPATEKERTFARQLAEGTLDWEDVPNTVDSETVDKLVGYYQTLNDTPETMLLRQRRAAILDREMEKMEPLLGMDVAYDEGGMRGNGKSSGKIARKTSTLRRNLQTPGRICTTEWGPEHGKKVYDTLFYPVTENNGRQIDWVNSMLDKVRTFTDSKGNNRELNRKERELVQKIVEYRASEKRVAAFDKQYKGAVENVRKGWTARDAAQEFGIDESYQEFQDLKNYETYLQALDELHDSKSTDDMAVGKAVAAYSELYQDLYEGINAFLVAHGYQPIGFIEGYAPHLQPEAEKTTFSKAMKLLGIDDMAMSLPTSISGKTADLKPYKQYNPFFQERKGVNTEYDIAKGFEDYVYYLGNIFYHTDDIMRIRTAEKYIRKTYSSEEASEQISWAENARNFNDAQIADFLKVNGIIQPGTKLADGDARMFLNDYIDKLYDQIGNVSRYSEMAKYLDNYANRLAGKQNTVDRGAEAAAGRGSLNWLNNLSSKYGGAKLAFNFSSALNQTAQLPMVVAENGEITTVKAMRDFFTTEKANFVKESNFLKGKKGIEWLLGPETGWEKFKELGFTMTEAVDSFTAYVAVRSKYLKEVRNGKSHEDAMKLADEYGRNVMGSRARGEKPVLFDTKNPFWQIATRFQLEAMNSWEHITRDLPNEVRQMAQEQGKAKAARTMGVRAAKYMAYAFLANLGIGALSGGSPVPYDLLGTAMEALGEAMGLTKWGAVKTVLDNVLQGMLDQRLLGTDEPDDDEDKDWWAFLKSIFGDVADDIPILGRAAALAGIGDQTLPVADLSKVGDLAKSVKNNGIASADTLDKALTAGGEFLFGGNQLRKTLQGGIAAAKGGVYSNGKLRYQVEQTPGNIAKGLLFGRSALNETQEYYADRTSDFTENQTEAFKQMQDAGVSAKDSYDLIQRLRSIEKTEDATKAELQRKALRKSDISGQGKFVVYYQTMASDKEVKALDAMPMDTDLGTVTYLLMDMKECDTDAEKLALIAKSKLTEEQKAALYKNTVAGDEDLEKMESLARADISDVQYFQYKTAVSGLTTREEKLNAINTLDLTNSQKNALYYLNSYAQSTNGKAPWNQGMTEEQSASRLEYLASLPDDDDDTPKWQKSLDSYLGKSGTASGYESALAALRRKRGISTGTDENISSGGSGYERALAVLRQRRAGTQIADTTESGSDGYQRALAVLRQRRMDQ